MAQKVHVVLIDDIDQSDAEETVSFALDGKDYAIDLSAQNASALRDAMAPYIAHARSAGRRGRRAGGGGAKTTNGASAAEIRAWARDNGFDVPERGRVSAEVREAYAAAH